MSYPPRIQEIVSLFVGLPEDARREMLVHFAQDCPAHEAQPGELFDWQDVRKDPECSDEVGVFLRDRDGKLSFKVTLGPKVQTLTRALACILCQGLNDLTPDQVVAVPGEFVVKIMGAELVRLRSRTVFYVLDRMKCAALAYAKSKQPDSPEEIAPS